MQLRDQVSYAYTLIGLMKVSKHRKLDDTFTLEDLDLRQIKLCNTAIATISILSLQEILCLIERERQLLKKQKHESPTYQDMRNLFRPDTFYR